MSNVMLSIGGREFTVACAEGEEAHVTGLGRMIDAKLASMGDAAGRSEQRMLLFAALLLADELHEMRSATQAPAATAAPAPLSAGASELSGTAARQLEAIALRLENLASYLEGRVASA